MLSYSIFPLVLLACRLVVCQSACQSCVMVPALLHHRRNGVPRFVASQLQHHQQPRLLALSITALSSGVASMKTLRGPLLRRSLAVVIVGSVAAATVLGREWFIVPGTSDKEDSSQTKDDQDVSKETAKSPLTSAMVATIGVYKNFISPLLPPACRFVPTCSQYGVQAIEEFGPSKGAILTAWRLLRCAPFGGKGYDPPKWPPVGYTYSSY